MKTASPIIAALLLFTGSLHAQPETTWSQVIGTDDPDYCYSVQQTGDGGYILAGKTYSYADGDQDFYLVKTNSNGDVLWERTYGSDDNEWCYSVKQTSDGGYILAGYVQHLGSGEHNMWVVKTDASGESEWDHTYGEDGHEECYVVSTTSDGGYILGGKTNSFGDNHYRLYVVKTSSSGDTLWTRNYHVGDWCKTIEPTSDGGYILGGAGWQGVCLVKIDDSGTFQWQQTWRGGAYNEDGFSVAEAHDGGFVLAGYKGRMDPNLYMVKTSAEGDTLWSRSLGDTQVDQCYAMTITGGGNYVLAGYTTSYELNQGAGLLVKTNPDGYIIWMQTFSGQDGRAFQAVRQTSEGGFILAGTVYGSRNDDMYLLKTGLDGTPVETECSAEPPQHFALHPAFPNPFNPQTKLKIDLAQPSYLTVEVYNILGESIGIVAKGHYAAGSHSVVFDGERLPAGIYFIRAVTPDWSSELRKVVLIK